MAFLSGILYQQYSLLIKDSLLIKGIWIGLKKPPTALHVEFPPLVLCLQRQFPRCCCRRCCCPHTNVAIIVATTNAGFATAAAAPPAAPVLWLLLPRCCYAAASLHLQPRQSRPLALARSLTLCVVSIVLLSPLDTWWLFRLFDEGCWRLDLAGLVGH